MKIRQFLLPLTACIILCVYHAFGQEDSTFKEPKQPNDEAVRNMSLRELDMSSYEFGLSSIILIFGFSILCLETFIMRQTKFSSDETIRLFSVTLIIISALFLITSAYSDTQMAPAMGLLGTLAGYLLGRTSNNNNKDQNDN